MGLDVENELKRLNARLKAGGTRVTVEMRGNSLLVRGTFPPKTQSGKTKPYQQRLFLGFRASLAGLRAAEQKAKIISAQLELKTFDWGQWLEQESPEQAMSIGSWLEKFEADHWNKTEKNRRSLRTWQDSYVRTFLRFEDRSQPLTLDAILTAIAKTVPESKTRQLICRNMIKLAKFAGMDDIEPIVNLKGNYSHKCVNPRNLPSDELIITSRESIKHPGWRWLFGMLATYGLRSHEVFQLDMTEFPIIRVLEDTKTGERLVYPLYPEWSETWNLSNIVYPPISLEYSVGKNPGLSIARWFWAGDIPFKAYDLRHSYARRCFEFNIPTNRSAKLMGHSEATHCFTYRRWIDEQYYRDKFQSDVFGDSKPKAPTLKPQE